ncbi:MAG: hypothetical protein CW349_06450 [Firmicutes bacterium]|nr:hypothetical protein [Bacillota bacterium]MBO2519318.1 hypothetical protein [Bacillota bacterium]
MDAGETRLCSGAFPGLAEAGPVGRDRLPVDEGPKGEPSGAAYRLGKTTVSPTTGKEVASLALRVGVVGVGSMGKNHARIYAQMPGRVKLVGVADIDAAQAQQVAHLYECEAYTDYRELLDRVDAVSIAVPTSLHFETAAHFLERGIHVLLEKPMTSTVEEGARLLQIARANGCTLQVGHVERFNPVVTELQRIVREEEITAVNIQRLSPYDGRVVDADVILDLMIHDLDILTMLFGQPIRPIAGMGRSLHNPEQVDYAVAMLQVGDETLATVTASRVTASRVRRMELSSPSAWIVADYIERRITITRNPMGRASRNGTYRQKGVLEQIYLPALEPLAEEIRHFLECIETQKHPLVSGETGLAALKLVEHIQRDIYGRVAERGMAAAL